MINPDNPAVRNLQARNNLAAAAQLIQIAAGWWPFPHAAGLIETLEQLRTKIRAQLHSPSEKSASSAVKINL